MSHLCTSQQSFPFLISELGLQSLQGKRHNNRELMRQQGGRAEDISAGGCCYLHLTTQEVHSTIDRLGVVRGVFVGLQAGGRSEDTIMIMQVH